MEANTRSSFSWKKVFFFLFFILLLLIALIPTLISSSFGKQALINFINKKAHAQTSIGHVSFGWFGPQKIEEIKIVDNQGEYNISCQSIQASSSLFSMIGKKDFGKIDIQSPSLKLTAPVKSSSKAPAKSPKGKSSSSKGSFENSSFPNVTVDIALTNGSLEILGQGFDPILFQGVDLTVDMPKDHSMIDLCLVGKTHQAAIDGYFDIKAHLTGVYQRTPSLTVQAKIDNLPIKGVDQGVAFFKQEMSGLIQEALGSSLNLNLDIKASPSMMDVSIDASSPQLKASLQTVAQNGEITLKAPGSLSLSITPSFSSKILSNFTLKNPVNANLQFSQLELPLHDEGIDFSKAAFLVDLSLNNATFITNTKQEIDLSSLQATLSTKDISKTTSVDVEANASYEGHAAALSFKGDLIGLLDKQMGGTIALQANTFPLIFIDQMLLQEGKLVQLLGDQLNMDLKGDLGKETSQLKVEMHTPQLDLPETNFSLNDALTLSSPALVNFRLSPQAASTLFPQMIQIGSATPMQLSIEQLSIPRSSTDAMHLKGRVTIPQMNFKKFFEWDAFVLNGTTLDLGIDTLDEIHLDLHSSLINTSADFALKGDRLLMKTPLQFTATITPDQFTTFSKDAAKSAKLLAPITLKGKIDPFTLPLEASDLSALQLQGSFGIDELKVAAPNNNSFGLKNISLNFQADAKNSNAKAHLFASEETGQGGVDAQVSLENVRFGKELSTNNSILLAKVSLQNINTALLETLMGSSGKWTALFGPNMNLNVDLQSSSKKQTLALNGYGQYIDMDISFVVKDNQIQLLKTPGHIAFTLTKEGQEIFNQLFSGGSSSLGAFEINKSATLSMLLTHFDLPLCPQKSSSSLFGNLAAIVPNWPQISCDLQVDIDNFTLFEKTTKRLVVLQDFIFDFSTPASGSYNFQLEGKVNAKENSPTSSLNEGTVSIKGNIEDLYSQTGQLDLSHPKIQVNAQISQLPTSLLDLLTKALKISDFKSSALFGSTLNATFSTQIQNWNGPVALNVNTQNTRASLSGQITNGILSLKEAAHAQVTITPELSQHILQDVNPLSISSISAKNPITLQVEAAGFSVPVHNFNLQGMNIPNARIELGQVQTKNEGNINTTLGLLKAKKSNELNLWFAPIDLHIKEGVVDCERTEILIADTYDVAIWGKINPIKDDVDMVLGLTAACLETAFGIKDLPKNYVMHLPMHGTMSNVKIDTGAATVKIAALMAWQQKALGGALGGNPAGSLFGQMIGKIATLPDLNANTPPAKHPFPWELEANKVKKRKTALTDAEKKKAIKKRDKPLKQLYKVLLP